MTEEINDDATVKEQEAKIKDLLKEIEASTNEIMEKLRIAGWTPEEITDFMNTAYLGKFEDMNET